MANAYSQILARQANICQFVEKIRADFSNPIATTLIFSFKRNEDAFVL